jgi:predicted XRE-type DNA-binding protein
MDAVSELTTAAYALKGMAPADVPRLQGAVVRLPRRNMKWTRRSNASMAEEHMKKKNIGSSLDSLLREEGIYEDVTATAIKRTLARQVEAAMQEKQLTKAEMARKMHTSRGALDRLLDPDYDAVTLSTLRKAAVAVGREIRIELV